jgi:hypothetical protein
LRRTILAAACLAFAMASIATFARAEAIGVDLYGVSYHFGQSPAPDEDFNQLNLGGGLDWVVRRRPRHTLFVDAGIYRDSFRNANRFLDVAWTHSLFGPLQAGAALAIFSTRSINDGELLMAPAPMLSVRGDRIAAHVVYLIKASNLSDFSALGAYATIYPFAPARARARMDTPDDSARATGLELTVIPHLQLTGFESATLGIRRRNGSGEWRLAADFAGMIQSGSVEIEDAHRVTRHDLAGTRTFALETRVQRLRRLADRRGVSLYGALGPILGYTNRDPDRAMRLWHLGAAGSCGVEWSVARRIALEAEYGLDLVASFGRRESGDVEEKLTGIALVDRPVRLGVTTWFR